MKEKILILAYMGTGKTWCEQKYSNIFDFDFQDFKFVYDKSIAHLPLEQRKGNVALRTENPAYPKNWISALLDKLENEENIVTVPFIDHVFDAVNSDLFKTKAKDVRVILAAPRRDNFDEYIERFKSRGNSDGFIERRSKEWPTLSDLFENSENYEKITLRPNQFLDDALITHGIALTPKLC